MTPACRRCGQTGSKLIQALLNICRNAVQALGRDGEVVVRTRIERHFTIRRQLHRLVIRIDVIDSGPGAPAELEGYIFYPLVTGRSDGTGLGLSIAQSLVQSHNGMIRYERIDNNTYFRIFLPVQEEEMKWLPIIGSGWLTTINP